MAKATREYKVVVLGFGGVGKSALTVQFVAGRFLERYDPTIEDFYRKEIAVDNVPCVLEILDTAGTEQFASMRDLYIKNGKGFLIVYSIINRTSLNEARTIKEHIWRVKGAERVPVVLVGNKCDCTPEEREVPTEEGHAIAKEWGCPFFETSARTKVNVNQIFAEVVKLINLEEKLQRERNASCCTIL